MQHEGIDTGSFQLPRAHRYSKLWGIWEGTDSICYSPPFVVLKITHTQAKVALSGRLLFKIKCFNMLTCTGVLVKQETYSTAAHLKAATSIHYLCLLPLNQDFSYNWAVLLMIWDKLYLYSWGFWAPGYHALTRSCFLLLSISGQLLDMKTQWISLPSLCSSNSISSW